MNERKIDHFYRKIISRMSLKSFLLVVIPPVLLVLLWQYAADIGWLSPHILPAPSKIWETFREFWSDHTYQTYFMISASRVIKGFLLGMVIGLFLGILMAICDPANKALSVITGVLRPIPTVGWLPIVLIWLGIGEKSKVAVITIGCFWSVFINTMDGIKGVNQQYLEVAKILEKGQGTTLRKVILPAALPNILTGIRLGFANAWRDVVAAEMLGAAAGIGYMISYARNVSRMDIMLIGLLTIGIVGCILDIVVIAIQDRILRWYSNKR